MVKTHVILFALLLCNLTVALKVEVEFDSTKDVIIHEGRIYLPIGSNLESEEIKEIKENKEKQLQSFSSAHEAEEQVTGSTFWFYIFCVFCKKKYFKNIYSLNHDGRSNVWINSRIFIH